MIMTRVILKLLMLEGKLSPIVFQVIIHIFRYIIHIFREIILFLFWNFFSFPFLTLLFN